METTTWKILIVDDDEDDYLLTRQMLAQAKHRSYQLEWARSYAQGLQMLLECTYDAVLMDYDLGAYNGLDLTRELIQKGCICPIILYTGRGSYEIDMEAMQAGVAMYLTKSEINPLLLERGIRYAIERKQNEIALSHANQALADANAALEQQKQELDQRYQERSHILESIQDGFFSIDRQWNITYINQRAAQTVSLEPQDLLGKNIWAAFPRLKDTALERHYRHAMHQRQAVQFEVQGVYRGIWYNVNVYPSAEGISVFWQDITHRKRNETLLQERKQALQRQSQELQAASTETENQKRLLQAVMEALPVGVLITDGQGGSLQINPAFRQVWGDPLPPAQTVDDYLAYQAWWADTGQPLAPHEWASAQAVLKGETVVGQILEIQRFDGKRGFVFNSAAPVRDAGGQVVGCAVAIQDITLLKQLQALSNTLHEIRLAMQAGLSQEAVLQRSLSIASQALGCQAAAVSLRKGGRWLVSCAAGFPDEVLGTEMDKDQERHAVLAIQTKKTVAISDAFQDERANQGHMRKLGVRSVLVAPIILRQEVVGVISFNYLAAPFEFQDIHIRFGDNLAAAVSLALENARLFESLKGEVAERQQAEKALRQSERRWAATLASIGDGVIATDTLGRVTFLNPVAEDLTGWTLADASGQPIREVFQVLDEHTRLPVPNPIDQVLAEGVMVGMANHAILTSKDGAETPVENSGAPIIDEQGEIAGAVLILRDISERRQKEAELTRSSQRLVETLESIQESFYAVDRDWRFTYINQNAAAAVGQQPQALLGKLVWEQFPWLIGIPFETHLRTAMLERLPVRFEFDNLQAGQIYDVHIVPSGDGISVFGIDISDHKRTEAAVQAYASQLERSNRDLEDFAFVASHDLEEPLRKVRAFAARLQEQAGPKLDAEEKDLLQRVQDAAGRMNRMVSDLLAYSRVTTHAKPLRVVSLSAVAAGVLSDLEDQIERTGGLVEVGELPVIEADEAQMSQLLQNLIGNALKFHKKGLPPRVQVAASLLPDPQHPQTVEIRVNDNGIGFDSEQAGRLFQPFQRLVGHSQFDGSGIGLAICRKIVERHCGTIAARGMPHLGAEFIVHLPLKQAPSTQKQP